MVSGLWIDLVIQTLTSNFLHYNSLEKNTISLQCIFYYKIKEHFVYHNYKCNFAKQGIITLIRIPRKIRVRCISYSLPFSYKYFTIKQGIQCYWIYIILKSWIILNCKIFSCSTKIHRLKNYLVNKFAMCTTAMHIT